MEKDEIEKLLEKYYEGKTSNAEERSLLEATNDPLFKHSLDYYKQSKRNELPKSFIKKVSQLISQEDKKGSSFQWVSLKVAAALVLILLSAFLIRMNATYNEMLARMETIQNVLAITLIDQQSVHLKLKALKLTESLPALQQELSQSLVDLLNKDENINVRMAAIETMAGFSKNDQIKRDLINTLEFEESFLVRAILVESLVGMNDPKLIEELKKMIEDENTDEELKNQIKEMIL